MREDDRLTAEDEAPVARRRARRRPASLRAESAVGESLAEDQVFDEGNDVASETDIAEDEFFAMFEDSINQSILPNLPKMEGYHVCWLSTSSARDTIPNRQRMGYQLITSEMCPGFEQATSVKSSAFPGVISINEMVAARIPVRLYERMMRRVHHELPAAEEAKMRAMLDQKKAEAEEIGGKLIEGDGMSSLGKRVPAPSFADI